MKRTAAALGAILLVASLGAPARAIRTSLSDANDVHGLLDLRSVVFRYEPGPYVWALATFGSWSVPNVWDRGSFVVELDTFGSRAIDYVVAVRSDGRSMIGDLFRRRFDGQEQHLLQLSAWRSGSRGAGVDVPRDAVRIGANRTSFFWSATSLFTGRRCAASCVDRAPNGGAMIEQQIGNPPAPSPTVSPSPSASASPTPSVSSTPSVSPSTSVSPSP
jgi:hypothetical protein